MKHTQSRTTGVFVVALLATTLLAEHPKAPSLVGHDDRYKTDILLILAHQDDDTAFSGYLARAIYDQRRSVAAVFITRGDAGESAVSNERGNALGAEREIEARRALASLGITNVWFLHAPNGPNTQGVLNVLEYWDHGSVLGQVVRLIRLTQPDVILSMLPAASAGENHPDHQAAGVLATEAFDLSGDPVVFAEQLGASGDDDPGGHNPEGLHPWQPKKIYFWSDAFDSDSSQWVDPPPASPFRKNFLEGAGPVYSNIELSPSRHVTYAQLAAEHASFYLSQDGAVAREALAKGNFKDFEPHERLVLGKSLVGGNVIGDVFDRVAPGAIAFARVERFPSKPREGLSMEFGGSWQFYKEFWTAHNLTQLAELLPIPEVSLRMGKRLNVPIVLHNDSVNAEAVNVTAVLPEGWSNLTKYSVYPLKAGESYPVSMVLMTPASGKVGWQEITWKTDADGRQAGSLTLRVCLRRPSQP